MLIRPDLGDSIAVSVLLAAEIGLFLFLPSLTIALIAHVVLIAIFWAVGHFFALPLLHCAAVFSLGTGPFGAAITICLLIGLHLTKSTPAQHAAWYHFLSGAAFDKPQRTIAQDLRVGRLGHHHAPPQHSFETIFATGTREQKQAALLWLAQQNTAEFTNELRLALDNDDNTIRIEAAAIAGRQRNAIAL